MPSKPKVKPTELKKVISLHKADRPRAKSVKSAPHNGTPTPHL